jgi:hypothetical protein
VEELWGCGNVEVFTVSRDFQLECRLLRFLGVEKTEGVGEWLRPFSLWRARVAGKPKLSLHSATTSSPVHTPQFLKHSGLDNSPGRSQHLNSRLIIVDSMALTGFNLRDSRNYDFAPCCPASALAAPVLHQRCTDTHLQAAGRKRDCAAPSRVRCCRTDSIEASGEADGLNWPAAV